MNIIYVRTYSICTYIYIYRYVPIVGGIGGPLRDKFWADFGAKKLGQKNSDQEHLYYMGYPMGYCIGQGMGYFLKDILQDITNKTWISYGIVWPFF